MSKLFVIALGLFWAASWAQPPNSGFDAASLKPSRARAGKDYRGRIRIGPASLDAKNVSLQDLLADAYQLQAYQIAGGPGWLDGNEYDIQARTDGPATPQQLRAMLQTLLQERFHLAVHRESKKMRVYALVQDIGGAKIHPVQEGASSQSGAFRGELRRLADLISIQLTIPASGDPTRPGVAGGAPAPVVDRTGLEGIYEFNLDVRPEAGADSFTMWQRFLRGQLGLKLESRREPGEILVVDRAEAPRGE